MRGQPVGTGILLAASIFGAAVYAQPRASAPASIVVHANQVTGHVSPAIGQATLRVLRRPAPLATINLLLPVAMESSWTPVTSGGTKGGPSIVQMNDGSSWLMVRASDDVLYGASINVASPTAVPATAWNSFGVMMASEPNCVGVKDSTKSRRLLCAYLVSGGAAEVAWLSPDPSFGVYRVPLGGKNAGARPSIIPDAVPYYAEGKKTSEGVFQVPHMGVGFGLSVWDGGTSVFGRNIRIGMGGGFGGSSLSAFLDEPTDHPGWQKISGAEGPVGCLISPPSGSARCAIASNNRIRIGTDAAASAGSATTPAVPSDASPETPPALTATKSGKLIVVTRNKAGRIMWTVSQNGGFSPWKDAGGLAQRGSGIACATIGEAPTCFVQGMDGRIYGRNFGTVMGL